MFIKAIKDSNFNISTNAKLTSNNVLEYTLDKV